MQDNRKRGAAKAAETRRKKKANTTASPTTTSSVPESESDCCCGICHEQYLEFTDSCQSWIGCDGCTNWFHFTCVGIYAESIPEFLRIFFVLNVLNIFCYNLILAPLFCM